MSRKTQLLFFFGSVSFMAMAMGIHDSIFNNFLSDTFALSADARGWLELPRELPGFLVFLTAGLLAALPMTRVGAVGTLVFAAGMVGMGLVGTHFPLMVIVMMVGSTGMHLLQPVTSTIAVGLSDDANRGRRMGQMGAMDTLGAVLGTGFVWLAFDRAAPPYRLGFLCAAGLGCIACGVYAFLHIPHLHKPRARLVVRKKFTLYYLLELVFGARKQIFITFGPWVLIKVYGAPATSMARLLLIAALIGIVFKPVAGLVVDRIGERAVMMADGLALTLVCIGYGYALQLTGSPEHARVLASVCFIADNLLFALGSARIVYVSRCAASSEELTSTLAMGVSINHVVSMTIPAVAGAVWIGFGYERVFLAAAVLALSNALLSSFVPSKRARLAGA